MEDKGQADKEAKRAKKDDHGNVLTPCDEHERYPTKAKGRTSFRGAEIIPFNEVSESPPQFKFTPKLRPGQVGARACLCASTFAHVEALR